MMIVLKGLEEQGLIVRSPHPRHANVLELKVTEPGARRCGRDESERSRSRSGSSTPSRAESSRPCAGC
jgi:DNA-binding MarR family transcriptional regulator